MDAITLLREDHQKVKQLFSEIEETEDAKKLKETFDEIMTELTVHERIEEEIFYPAVEARAQKKEVKELVIESYLEHGFVDRVAEEVLKDKPGSETWKAKAKIMKEQLEHHAFEEEEGKLFPKVKEIFSAEELTSLGEEMLDLKETAMEELEKAAGKA
ncbi:MAG TPA: hemerythrin domain-containing protein [Thermoanaerobaculia bacterium]|nr:hemerythrin domain-containing protein [Thermoanaerobaculia bacterium]